MSVTDLDARRWANAEAPQDHKPIAALKEAIRQIEAGEIECDHIIIIHGRVDDRHAKSGWMQAGAFDAYQQLGVIERVKLEMVAG